MILFPGERTSDSLNVILPGMSMSNKCTFRCVVISSPDGEKVKDVLKYFLVFVSSSGIDPPTKYVLVSEAMALSAWNDGDCSLVGGEGRRVSAYLRRVCQMRLDVERCGREGDKRREVIAAIWTIEAFWQHYYLCPRFGSFMNFLSCMRQIGRLVCACSSPLISTQDAKRGVAQGNKPEANCTRAILTGFFSNFGMLVIVLLELKL